MTHYLSAEMFRTVRRRYLYWTLGVCALVLLGVVSLFAYANSTIDDPSQMAHTEFLFLFFIQFLPSIGLYFTLLIGDMTFSEEHKVQTMRNTLFYGTPRITVYLGKFINSLIFCCIMMVVLLAVAFGLSAVMLGIGPEFQETMASFGMMLAGCIPLWIAGAALAVALYSNIPSTNLAAFSFIGIFVVPTSLLRLTAFMTQKEIFGQIRSLLITSRLDELAKGTASEHPDFLITCWITGMVFTAIFLIAGYAAFSRKEIK